MTERFLRAAVWFWQLAVPQTLRRAGTAMLLFVATPTNAEQYGPPKLGLNILYKIDYSSFRPETYYRYIVSQVEGDKALVTRSVWEGPVSGSGPTSQDWIRYGFFSPTEGCTSSIDTSAFKSVELDSALSYEIRCDNPRDHRIERTERRIVSRQKISTPAGAFDTILIEATTRGERWEDAEAPGDASTYIETRLEWYAPALGMYVRRDFSSSDRPDETCSDIAISIRYGSSVAPSLSDTERNASRLRR